VLLTSGFMGEGAVLETAEFPLLDKPYETAQLAAKLRNILDKPVRKRKGGGGGARAQAAADVAPVAAAE
jgi:hypothetical protein